MKKRKNLMRVYIKGALLLVIHNMIFSGSIFFTCSVYVGYCSYMQIIHCGKMSHADIFNLSLSLKGGKQ